MTTALIQPSHRACSGFQPERTDAPAIKEVWLVQTQLTLLAQPSPQMVLFRTL